MKDKKVNIRFELSIGEIAEAIATDSDISDTDVVEFVGYLDELIGNCDVTDGIIARLEKTLENECIRPSRKEVALKKFIYWLFSRGHVDGYTDEEFDAIVKQYMKERRLQSGNENDEG